MVADDALTRNGFQPIRDNYGLLYSNELLHHDEKMSVTVLDRKYVQTSEERNSVQRMWQKSARQRQQTNEFQQETLPIMNKRYLRH